MRIEFTFDGERHVYLVEGGPVPSVTQVLHTAGLASDYSMVPPDLLGVARWSDSTDETRGNVLFENPSSRIGKKEQRQNQTLSQPTMRESCFAPRIPAGNVAARSQ